MKQQIPTGQEAVGHTVAFYDQGSLHLGLVAALEAENYNILLLDKQYRIINPSRIILCSKACYPPLEQSLADFVHQLQLQELPELTVSTEGQSFEDIAQANRITGDFQLFALLLFLKDNPQIYLQKHDLYYRRTPESEAKYLRDMKKQEVRQQYLDAVIRLAHHPEQSPDPGLRADLLLDLRLLLQGERIDDLAKALKNAGNINPAWLRKALGDTLSLPDPPMLESGLPIAFIKEDWATGLRTPHIATKPITAFCIDDEGSRDFDDALSLEKDEEGYLLGIHVSNLADYFDRNHALFLEAKARISSLYLPSGIVPMLPPLYSERMFSLNANQDKAVLSLFVRFDTNYNMLESNIEMTSIRVMKNYSYRDVDRAMQHDAWQPLFRIADALNTQREPVEKNDAQRYIYNLVADAQELQFKRIDLFSPSRRMIEEMMILYNRFLADFTIKHNIPVLYRNIKQIYDEEKQWQISTAYLSTEAGFHPGIGAEAYLHVTSPIRRFVDLVNQMQVVGFLRKEVPAFTTDDLDQLIPVIDKRLLLLRETAQRSERYWVLKYVERYLLHTPMEGCLKAVINGKYRVELLPWSKQVFVALDAIPQNDIFTFAVYDIDWDKMLLKADLIC
ncbi:MAG: ribonuclease catalytic domain-containing protein [Candidatus Cloacimonetes bacterium]|nr:ribonuclease catalytic domain-containing protein [Candidatus Cloacimonadota bacterium]MDD2506953.1 ribonuclease catalytic domain-containing protein [Candidatus Cloacimonadota bacterium]MDD4147465.1 ribonuclease catalytic domain-containing protein [Candidatus Cloacimonadota bacterium]MDD4560578.1 ribonuclease catalytic domain-containing protein [Candidatus Cloacimonadota bacterium]